MSQIKFLELRQELKYVIKGSPANREELFLCDEKERLFILSEETKKVVEHWHYLGDKEEDCSLFGADYIFWQIEQPSESHKKLLVKEYDVLYEYFNNAKMELESFALWNEKEVSGCVWLRVIIKENKEIFQWICKIKKKRAIYI